MSSLALIQLRDTIQDNSIDDVDLNTSDIMIYDQSTALDAVLDYALRMGFIYELDLESGEKVYMVNPQYKDQI